MWSSGLTLDRSRLSRRAFLGGATGAVCASALLSSSASQGAPAAPQAPAAAMAGLGRSGFCSRRDRRRSHLRGAGRRRSRRASFRRGGASRAHVGEPPPRARGGRAERGRPRVSPSPAHGLCGGAGSRPIAPGSVPAQSLSHDLFRRRIQLWVPTGWSGWMPSPRPIATVRRWWPRAYRSR